MTKGKRFVRLSSELQELQSALDESWEDGVAAYCRELHDRLAAGEDPITISREFKAIRRLGEFGRQPNE